MNLLGVNRGYAGTGSFATTAEALSIIEDVRRIELAFEGHRYYDRHLSKWQHHLMALGLEELQ